jgi:hypothetical protein
VIAAAFFSPWAGLAVAIAYLVIQQLEGHVLAPNIVGNSVGVHPLLVIFALLAGAQIGGILGMIAALPILAMLKHTFTFYDFKFSRAPWVGDDGVVLSQATVTGSAAPEAIARPVSPGMGPLATKLVEKVKAARKTVNTKAAKAGEKIKTAKAARSRRKSE